MDQGEGWLKVMNNQSGGQHEGRTAWFLTKFELEYNAAQDRYLGLGGTETFTPGYTLFNAGITSEIKYNENNNILVIVQVSNLHDKAYQSHLNRLKYFEYFSKSPNGHYGIYDMGRNIQVKIVFPF